MKSGFVIFLVATFIVSFQTMGTYENYKETDDIEYLLNERIQIINDFLYGVKDIDTLREGLEKVEADHLLQTDLTILEKVVNNPTDYELAMNAEADEIISIEKMGHEMIIVANLKWIMRGYDGEFEFIKKYRIKYVSKGGRLYLTELKIIE